MEQKLKSPFTYFGGKSKVAHEIWDAFGQVDNYIEPFFGSGSVLLNRPGWRPNVRLTETVNDVDGFLANFWRALQSDPDGVAEHADWPVNESDLEARHLWLVNRRRELTDKLNDPDFYDVKYAGWWVWGMNCWIGSGWCSGRGPWIYDEELKKIVKKTDARDGCCRKFPHLGDDGRGVNRQLPHLGDDGRGLYEYLRQLAQRLRYVRVCCGDWSRVLGPAVTVGHGVTAVFLDPPYSTEAGRDMGCYAIDCGKVAHDVRSWCEEHGEDKLMRICLAGYEGEGHDHLIEKGWRCFAWKAHGGYENQSNNEEGPSVNCRRERLWFSPHCVDKNPELF